MAHIRMREVPDFYRKVRLRRNSLLLMSCNCSEQVEAFTAEQLVFKY